MRVVHKAGSSMAGGVVGLAAPQSASDRLSCVSGLCDFSSNDLIYDLVH